MIRESISCELVERWAKKHLISKESGDNTFEVYENWESRISKFGTETTLYSVNLVESFVLAVVDGSVPSAAFEYEDLMRSIRDITNEGKCYWIYITEPDNSFAEIEEVRQHNWTYSQAYHLELLEKRPAAEGGCSHLCLLSDDKSWVLVHELNPGNDFTISIHSDEAFGKAILKSLQVQQVADIR